MNIKEIYEKIEDFLTKPGRKAEEYFEVVIESAEPRMAPPAVIPVKEIKIGTDHHKNEIIITPVTNIVPEKSHRDVYHEPIFKYEWYRPKGIAYCPNCQCEIGEPKYFPNYCPHCGQQVKKDEEIPSKRQEA